LLSDTAQRHIFNELKRWIGIRKKCSAFHPACKQKILDLGPRLFAFIRYNEDTDERIYCVSNLSGTQQKTPPLISKAKKGQDLLTGDCYSPADPVLLDACQTRWIKEE